MVRHQDKGTQFCFHFFSEFLKDLEKCLAVFVGAKDLSSIENIACNKMQGTGKIAI